MGHRPEGHPAAWVSGLAEGTPWGYIESKDTPEGYRPTMAMDPQAKQKLLARLKRAEGQLAGVRRMVEADTYCVDVLTQISAVNGALDRVGQLLLSSHIEHCVTDALRSDDDARRQATIAELMDVFARYQKRRAGT